MKIIIKREIKNYLRNPLYWIGIVLVIAGIYQAVSPYLKIQYFKSDQETAEAGRDIVAVTDIADADIMQGYAPSSEARQISLGCAEIARQLTEFLEVPEDEAKAIMNDLQQRGMTIPEITEFLDREYGYPGADFYFEIYEYHCGTMEEANRYITDSLEEHPYSYYFARKFADFAGLFMGFFTAVMLAFLFVRDTRRDTYELLHTKPISAGAYILGKAGGGLLVILLVLVILNVVFGSIGAAAAGNAGFSFHFTDMILATAVYIVPNMLMIVSVYSAAALLFRNSLPAAPLLILYMIYSNMGSIGPDGNYGYYGRPLAIMVRFPGKFFEIVAPPMAHVNQLFLLAASAVLLLLAVRIWRRRRSY